MNLNLTDGVQTAIAVAATAAARDVEGHPVPPPPVVEPVHLLAGIVAENGVGAAVLRQMGVDPASLLPDAGQLAPDAAVRPGSPWPQLSPTATRVLSESLRVAAEHGLPYVTTDHLLVGLTRVPGARELLRVHGIEPSELEAAVRAVHESAAG